MIQLALILQGKDCGDGEENRLEFRLIDKEGHNWCGSYLVIADAAGLLGK